LLMCQGGRLLLLCLAAGGKDERSWPYLEYTPEQVLMDREQAVLPTTSSGLLAAVKTALRQVVAELRVPDCFAELLAEVQQDECYLSLQRSWDRFDAAQRQRGWQQLRSFMVQAAYRRRPYCIRCGECCRRSTPSLHPEDVDLLQQGVILPGQLYTLRKGELVNFNLAGRLARLPVELIKVKQQQGTTQCIFYQADRGRCAIYQHRPLQCRVQACWDPGQLERLWQRRKLSRRDLFQQNREVLNLLQSHEERCGVEQLYLACQRFRETGGRQGGEQLLAMLQADAHWRASFAESLPQRAAEMDFLFGRPLMELIKVFSLEAADGSEGGIRFSSQEP